MTIDLNDLLALAGVRIPMLSVDQVRGDVGNLESSMKDCGILSSVDMLCIDSLSPAGAAAEILPLSLRPLGQKCAIIFVYRGEHLLGQGACYPESKTLLFSIPLQSSQEFSHVMQYQDDTACVSGILKMTVLHKDNDWTHAKINFTLEVGTLFQLGAENALRELSGLIVAKRFPETQFEQIDKKREKLRRALAAIRPHSNINRLISLAETEDPDAFNVICEIVGLTTEERDFVWRDWLFALKGEKSVNLPFAVFSTFYAEVQKGKPPPLWSQVKHEETVPSRAIGIEEWMSNLVCHASYPKIAGLATTITYLCTPFRSEKSFWRDLASKVVLATLMRKSETATFKL